MNTGGTNLQLGLQQINFLLHFPLANLKFAMTNILLHKQNHTTAALDLSSSWVRLRIYAFVLRGFSYAS